MGNTNFSDWAFSVSHTQFRLRLLRAKSDIYEISVFCLHSTVAGAKMDGGRSIIASQRVEGASEDADHGFELQNWVRRKKSMSA